MVPTKEYAIQTITQHRQEIAELGVAAIGLIGSVARGEAHDTSDLDVVIDLPPEHQTLREYFAIVDTWRPQFGRHVDVLMLDTLAAKISPRHRARRCLD